MILNVWKGTKRTKTSASPKVSDQKLRQSLESGAAPWSEEQGSILTSSCELVTTVTPRCSMCTSARPTVWGTWWNYVLVTARIPWLLEKKFIILTSILSLRSLSDTTQWRWRELHKRYTLSAPLRRLLAHHPALSASQCACQHCVLAVKHPCHMVRLWGRASVSCRFRECRWRRCYKNASKGWSWVVT